MTTCHLFTRGYSLMQMLAFIVNVLPCFDTVFVSKRPEIRIFNLYKREMIKIPLEG